MTDADTLDGLAAACAFLSRLFLEPPDAALAARLREADPEASWPLRTETPARAQGLRLLAAWAATAADRGAVARTAAEYVRLFRGPDHVPVCPYESVHREVEHLTFGDATVAVRGWYERYGLQAPRLHVEPDDHVGLELAFVAHLLVSAVDSPDRDLLVGQAGEFARTHLLTYVDAVADALAEHADDDLYRALGLLLADTCAALAAALP